MRVRPKYPDMQSEAARAPVATIRKPLTKLGVPAVLVVLLALALSVQWTPARARPEAQAALCGSGSAPDYGFTYDLLQEHWTVNWQDYVSRSSVTEVDAILDRLNADAIAQTMILFLPADEVGVRVNCAVHFLRYMRLGLPAGERKDNGFVFLIVVEPAEIDVHYGVGLGLPALTAAELTPINRAAEQRYEATGSLDEALLTLVRDFDTVSRSNYAPLPLPAPAPTPVMVDVPQLPAGPLGVLVLCGVLCLVTLVILFLLWLAYRVARAGIEIGPYGTDTFGRGSGWGGGSSWGRGGFGGGSRGGGRGGFGGGPTMRGGGGSGRSGRGN